MSNAEETGSSSPERAAAARVPDRPVSLSDVARLANVSTATASQALNGGPVAAATRERVVEAARKLRYVPRASARTLRTGRGTTLGLWIVNQPGNVALTEDSSYFYSLIRGAGDGAGDAGYGLSLRVMNSSMEDVAAALDAELASGSLSALVVVPQWANDGSYVTAARRHDLPVVAIGDLRVEVDSVVSVDNRIGMDLAVEYLAESGHERIGYLAGPEGHLDADRRLESFLRAVSRLGLRVPSAYLQRAGFTIEAGVMGMRRLAQACTAAEVELPTAILAADDYVAAGAMRVAAGMGLRIPEDLSVIGYDDVDVARATNPELTTIRQPLYELGRSAAVAAIALSRGGSADAATRLAPELVVRESVADRRASR